MQFIIIFILLKQSEHVFDVVRHYSVVVLMLLIDFRERRNEISIFLKLLRRISLMTSPTKLTFLPSLASWVSPWTLTRVVNKEHSTEHLG